MLLCLYPSTFIYQCLLAGNSIPNALIFELQLGKILVGSSNVYGRGSIPQLVFASQRTMTG